MKNSKLMKTVFLFMIAASLCCCKVDSKDNASQSSSYAADMFSDSEVVKKKALIVISPHPDDESIMAAGTIYRACHDPDTLVQAVYLSSGDAAGGRGKCHETSEEIRRQKIVELRENETRNAWAVLGLDPSYIHFLRYPDKGMVSATKLVKGKRIDTLNTEGTNAIAEITELVQGLVPEGTQNLTIISGSGWDGHPDHRVDYYCAKSAALAVSSNMKIPVTLLSMVVHDEFIIDLGFCCIGDLFWPNKGPAFKYCTLANSRQRPRPPMWDLAFDISDLGSIKSDAIKAHVSQVTGYPPLCMTVLDKEYYRRWMEKKEEVFYKEEFPAAD
ncbi:MAG TPA: PIG-L family deacetylase [Desulfomonilia bacterium]